MFQPAADVVTERAGLDRVRLATACLDAASVAWVLPQGGSLSAAVLHGQGGDPAVLRVGVTLL